MTAHGTLQRFFISLWRRDLEKKSTTHTPLGVSSHYTSPQWPGRRKTISGSCGTRISAQIVAKDIPEGKRVGSGKKSEGGFCSLDCYASYYKGALIERAKKAAVFAERHRKS